MSNIAADIQAAIKRAKLAAKRSFKEDCELALQYLSNDIEGDVRSQLSQRFGRAQRGGTPGQEIHPVFFNLVQRFADEMASAYNKTVTRKYVDPVTLEETEATKRATLIRQRAQGAASYNEAMQEMHRRLVVLRSYGVWHQWANGLLSPQFFQPGDINPVAYESAVNRSRARQDDYEGFVVEIDWSVEDASKASSRQFALIRDEDVVYFRGTDATSPDESTVEVEENPYKWLRDVDGKQTMAPGRMFSIWHHRFPIDMLLPPVSTLAHLNREINVAVSSLVDTVRWQAWAQPVLAVMNKSDPPSRLGAGVRFPWTLNVGETADMLQAQPTYQQQIEVLRFLVSLAAWTERLSPGDLDLTGTGASVTSGFSKLVESLPKLEARGEMLTRLTAMEENYAGPRDTALLVAHAGMPEEALRYKTRVTFDGVRFPETQDERAKRYETDLKHGLTTRAKILADEKGIPLEEAQAMLEEHMEANGAHNPQPPQGPPQGLGDGGGALVPGDILARLVNRGRRGERDGQERGERRE